MTTTYRKEPNFQQPLVRDIKYNDYDVESGMSKRVNCLVGFTVVSIIIGAAGLALSIMLLLQGSLLSTKEGVDVATLQQRVKLLERLSGIPDPTKSVIDISPAGEDGESSAENPLLRGILPENLKPPAGEVDHDSTINEDKPDDGHDHSNHHNHLDHHVQPHPEDGDNNKQKGLEGGDLEDPVPYNPHNDDDEDSDREGSGDCPVYSRPACPRGISICESNDACPIPICCKPDNN
ncbi:uncharacterized protein LOC121866491 [Homarus americanus]|uniref:uncharacterized protein LOC121866491 n=1 Tax=Homarus americanus TaxID=6706 RepID=UPI001C492177|nr:uncharacterized protein LOC121866491 [Homarus americanus]